MKKQIKVLAVIAAVLVSSISGAFANPITTTKVEVKPNSEIVKTLNKKAKKIAKKNSENIDMYLAVMDLYTHHANAFYNLDQATQNKFIKATNSLNEALLSSRKKEVRELAAQIGFQQGVSEFIWSVKKSYSVVLPIVDSTKENQNASI